MSTTLSLEKMIRPQQYIICNICGHMHLLCVCVCVFGCMYIHVYIHSIQYKSYIFLI